MATSFQRAVAQVVAFVQKLHLPFHDLRLCGRHLGDGLVKVFENHDGRVAVRRLLGPKIAAMQENDGCDQQNHR